MVNDGSKDNSYGVMQKLADQDPNIKIVSLSRNFGSHAAILCGLEKSTGDCAVVKAADLPGAYRTDPENGGKLEEGQ